MTTTSVEDKSLPAVYQPERLLPILSVGDFQMQLRQLQEIVSQYLEKGQDYGKLPGTDKDALFQPGAQKLAEIYGLRPTFHIAESVQDFDKGLFDYIITCKLWSVKTSQERGEGLGSCSSYENKYRYRKAERECPECGKQAIIKGKAEYGGGWICWTKKEGCNAKFGDDAPAIVDQPVGRVVNDDLIATKNTVLKMAKKRALVDAVISTTRSSGIFTQDVEDFIDAKIEVAPLSGDPQYSTDEETGEVTLPPLKPVSKADWDTVRRIGLANRWPEGYMAMWIKKELTLHCEEAVYRSALDKFGQDNTKALDDTSGAE